MGNSFAAKTREALRTAVAGNYAEFHFRLADARIFAGDAHGARKSQFTAAAKGEAIYRGDRRFSHGFEAVKNLLPKQRKVFAVDRRALREFVDVRARNKRFFARAGENQHAHRGVFAGAIESVAEFLDSLAIESVQHLGAVESDVSDLVSNVEQEIFIGHSWAPSGRILVSCSSELHRARLGWVRIIVEAATRLAPVPTGKNHALQQRRRREALLLEFIEHDVGDVIGCVQADEIEKRERPHRIAAAELHRVVNVFDGGDAAFQHAHRIEKIRHKQTVYNEAGAVGRSHGHFANAAREGDGLVVDLRVRGNGADHFYQLHQRNRIKKVQTDETLRALGEKGHLGNRQRRSVAGENCLLAADFVERRVQLALLRQLLDNHLDNQGRIFQIFQFGRSMKARSRCVTVASR